MGIYYLGAFPPDYGGVTVKNQNLYNALKERIEIEKIDFNLIKRKNLREIVHFFAIVFKRNNRFVIGVSGKKTRKRFTQLLYYFNRKAMCNSIILLMGGTASNDIVSDAEYLKCARGYKKIYAETESMVKILKDAGLHNGEYYPNGRHCPQKIMEINASDGQLKCVFMSAIRPEKGVDIILEAAKIMSDVSFTFYGEINERFRYEFEKSVANMKNVNYKGIFTGNTEAIYNELSQYDILLLPTRWKAEGVPGIFVEAKIAGLAIITSAQNYNSEIIKNGKEGIILKENNAKNLVNALKIINQDREVLMDLKEGSLVSAKKFFIENYIDSIVREIEGSV